MLDDILNALDAPRQSVWNAGRGLSNYITGDSDASWRDVVPGALGALGTAGLAATGIGLPAAIAAGTALAGAGQLGVGREAMKPSDFVAKQLDLDPESAGAQIGGMIAGGLTDPLTYAGAGLGRMAGRGVGGVADRAAQMAGPRYGTTASDVMDMVSRYEPQAALSPATEISSSPQPAGIQRLMAMLGRKAPASEGGIGRYGVERKANQIAEGAPEAFSHIPPGSSILGAGVEGMAFKTPSGQVVRIGNEFAGGPGRPISSNVLQSSYATDYPWNESWGHNPDVAARVERLPLAGNVNDAEFFEDNARKLGHRLKKESLSFRDVAARNMGEYAGRPVVIDPGSVEDVAGQFAGGYSPVTQAGQPGTLASLLERGLGGKSRMQAAVESGLANPEYARQLATQGTAGGGLAGLILGNQGR